MALTCRYGEDYFRTGAIPFVYFHCGEEAFELLQELDAMSEMTGWSRFPVD